MSNRVRYTRQTIANNNFYQLPKFLFNDEFSSLSNDARVLYALLRNRHEISIKNGWYDENDEVFLYFKREDMQSMLNLSGKTIAKAMRDLKEHRLIEEHKQGFSKPNRIYLLSVIAQPFGIETDASIPGDFTSMNETQQNEHTRKNYASIHGDFTPPYTENFRVYKNHNKDIHNNINNNSVMSSQSSAGHDVADGTAALIDNFTKLIKRNIRYSDFEITRPTEIVSVDEIVIIMVDVIVTKGGTVCINGEDKPRELVKSMLLKLDYGNVELVLDRFKSQTNRILNKRQYILTMLYNSKMELDSHYTNLVNYHMYEKGASANEL